MLSGLGVAVLAHTACRETVTAPGVCPAYCPATQIQVIDSIFPASIVRDSSFSGYATQHRAAILQLATDGGSPRSRAIVRFRRFVSEFAGLGAVLSVDSFRIDLRVVRRAADVDSVALVLHRLPVTVDTLATFADLDPFFVDSTVIDTIIVTQADTSGTVSAVVATGTFPSFEADSLAAAIGVTLHAGVSSFLNLGAIEAAASAQLTRFATVDSSGVGVPRDDAQIAELDTFVPRPSVPVGVNLLRVGGIPAARAVLRVRLPPNVIDSADVIRATLVAVLDRAAIGADRDTVLLRADPLAKDVGPKSPLIVPQVATQPPGLTKVPVGSTDTIRLDVTHLLRPWRADTTFPRTMVLRVVPEGGTLGDLRLRSSRSGTGRPFLRVTYVPIVREGG